jgi:hypothetical protein
MATFLRRARLIVDLGLALLALGLAGLLLLAWVAYLRTPGMSLLDGYWMGHEPWTSLAVWTVLIGSAVTLIVGVVVGLLDGSWIRRILALAATILPVSWWLVALGFVPYPRFHGPNPVSFGYSLPEQAGIALVLPALVAAAVALFPRRATPTSRMAPVHEDRTADREGTPGL